MRKIFKYEISSEGATDVRMPVGSTLLSVGFQNGAAFLWAKVNTRAHDCIRRVISVPTGGEIAMSVWQAPLIGVIRLKSTLGEHFAGHVFDMGEKNL